MKKKNNYKHSLLSRSNQSPAVPIELPRQPHKGLHLPLSEIVIKNIISQLITKATYIGNANFYDNKIPNHCYNYVNNFISPILHLRYMNYDTENDLSCDIALPKNSFIDSLSTTHVNVVKLQSNSDMKESSMFSEQNEINKTSSRKIFTQFRKYTNSISKRNSIFAEMKIPKQLNTKEVMESLPYYDLHGKVNSLNNEKEPLSNKESSYIIALRKEVEEKEKKKAMNIKKRNLLMNGIVLSPSEINTVNDVELIEKHNLPAHAGGTPSLAHLSFTKYPLELKTLYTVLMLKKGFLGGIGFYPTITHTPEIMELYYKAIDEVFAEIKDVLGKNDYQALLDAIGGPVCHSGFARLLK